MSQTVFSLESQPGELRGVVTLKGKKSVMCFLLSSDITHFTFLSEEAVKLFPEIMFGFNLVRVGPVPVILSS